MTRDEAPSNTIPTGAPLIHLREKGSKPSFLPSLGGMSNSGMAKGHARTPPLNGVFPLDHGGECRAAAAAYLQCVRTHRGQVGTSECQDLAKAYFRCRLENGLLDPNETWYQLESPRGLDN